MNLICETCGKKHDGSYGSGRFCSSECSHSYSAKSNNAKRIQSIKKASEIAIVSGRHNGLSGKSTIIESAWYEELRARGFSVQLNYPVYCDSIENNNRYYRFDLLVGKSVDLEIDGLEFHKNTSEKDKKRDEYLESLGYHVYRVPYVNPKRNYSKFLKQVSEFTDWYSTLR